MTTAILAAAQVLAEAGIRTTHTLDAIGERVRALIDPQELPVAARRLDLQIEIVAPESRWAWNGSDPALDGWTWGVMTVGGVEVRAGIPPVG